MFIQRKIVIAISFLFSKCLCVIDDVPDTGKAKKGSLKSIRDEDYVPMIMEFIAALQKEQLRLKYEIGQDIYKIAQYQSANGTQENEDQVTKLTSSINSFLSEDFMAAKSLYDIQNNKINVEAGITTTTTPSTTCTVSAKTMVDVINGFKEVDQPTMDKFLIMVINAENMQLFKLCLDNNLIVPGAHHYRTAIKNSKTNKQSAALNEIIERLATFDLDIKAYREDYPKITFDKNFKVLDAQKLISENNFPMLRRLLAQGFNPNTHIPNIGSLLGFAVIEQCVKCVEILVSKGVDVNAPVEFNAEYRFKALGTERNPNGWTPLMIAAAHGNPHLVKALVASNTAEVTKPSNNTKELHARSIARLIVNKKLRKELLMELKTCPVDQSRIEIIVGDRSLTMSQAIRLNDMKKIDALVLSGKERNVNSWLYDSILYCGYRVVESMIQEYEGNELPDNISEALKRNDIIDKFEKTAMIQKYADNN